MFLTAASLLVALFCLQQAHESTAQDKKIPDYIHICKRNDPEISKCIQQSVEELRPYLAKGIPEFGVPSIEPLHLKEIIATGGPALRITSSDIKAFGCSDFTINRLDVDMEKNLYSFGIDLPLLFIDARYEVDGRILLIPIRGSGPMKLNFTNCKGDVDLQGEMVTRDGEVYLNFSDMRVKVQVGKGQIVLENLFGGEKILGEVVNNAINANFGQFVKELLPSIERALSSTFLEISNDVVRGYTLNQLLPEE